MSDQNIEYNTSSVVLGYVLSPDKTKVLMLHHNWDSSDISYGKYNAYSDRMRVNESSYETLCRVVMEHTGLTVKEARFRGDVHWPNFVDRNKSVLGLIFTVDRYEGIELESNRLGRNRWVTISEVLRGDVPTWEGDKHILPLIFDKNPKPVHGYMPYEKGLPRGWFFNRG